MKKSDRPGFFIAFEGLDGSGSAHHAAALARILERDGYRVVLSHEPTNSMIGGLIRSRLAGEWEIAPETLQLLFTADRAEHLAKKILPALVAGRVVICDRYILSALAYNVVLVNDPEWLRNLNARFIEPHLTFYIQVNAKLCARRRKEARFELDLRIEEKKLLQVEKEYNRHADMMDSIYSINGERDDVAIIDEILEITRKHLERHPVDTS
ncbi:dTMP kinase [Candidatus Berkelbacteria bacterium]|nr:dTMP kinase [Candidatus Berkelbacteria bacterium]